MHDPLALLDLASRLFEAGSVREAIATLSSASRAGAPDIVLKRLAEMRHAGFFALPAPPGPSEWPPRAPASSLPPGVIPAVAAEGLDADMLRRGIIGHGALIVRGLLQAPQVAVLIDSIDAALDAYDRSIRTGLREGDGWYWPLRPCAASGPRRIERKWVREGGGVLAADSPRALFNLFEALGTTPAIPAIREYFGEEPALSVKKTTLRRVAPTTHGGWHQDGAFLGADIRTVNVWIALSDCGDDAPSLDMVPRRMEQVLPTGDGGAIFSWSLDEAALLAAAGPATPPVRLHFKAGDAILFDERNLHCTGVSPGMSRDRYAIEAWFFAPSRYPLDQMPILC